MTLIGGDFFKKTFAIGYIRSGMIGFAKGFVEVVRMGFGSGLHLTRVVLYL